MAWRKTWPKAADVIAELKDALNERELSISRLQKEKEQDERAITHLRERDVALSQEVSRMEGMIRTKNAEREVAYEDNRALKAEIARLSDAHGRALRAAEHAAFAKQQNLSFRADIAQTILGHCTLNETIAKDVSMVLAGGLEGIVTRLG